MMLRNRSRAVTTKQALMADQTQTPNPVTLSSPTTPVSSFLNSPRFFNGFWKKNRFSDASETNSNNAMAMIMSPTSILDTKNNNLNNSFVNPFGYDNCILSPTAKRDTTSSKGIGLALIDSTECENPGKFSKPINRTALFGSKLKVQIPVAGCLISSNEESPKSPADFGIKTKNSQISSPGPPSKDCYFTRQLSLKEMELSEDYTRVITHGPNPKTTHIFDDCIVESCLGDSNDSKDCEEDKKMECGFENSVSTSDFLSFCHTCKDILGHGKDIYIYRGEKAFCSHECRSEEIYYQGMKNLGSDE